MKKLLLLSVSLFVLTGCKYSIDGVLNVTDSINLDNQEYAPGSYDTSVSIKRTTFSRRYKITMKVDSHQGEVTHTFKAPKGATIPENGRVSFTAEQLKENYGLNGEVSTVYSDDTRRRRTYESCTYQEPYTVCRTDARGRTYCHTEYRTRFGQREVEYFLRTKEQDLNFDLMSKTKSMASFEGHYRNTYPVYIYEGRCF